MVDRQGGVLKPSLLQRLNEVRSPALGHLIAKEGKFEAFDHLRIDKHARVLRLKGPPDSTLVGVQDLADLCLTLSYGFSESLKLSVR
jgi:hypothetical protein